MCRVSACVCSLFSGYLGGTLGAEGGTKGLLRRGRGGAQTTREVCCGRLHRGDARNHGRSVPAKIKCGGAAHSHFSREGSTNSALSETNAPILGKGQTAHRRKLQQQVCLPPPPNSQHHLDSNIAFKNLPWHAHGVLGPLCLEFCEGRR